jgi:hypothetical protein
MTTKHEWIKRRKNSATGISPASFSLIKIVIMNDVKKANDSITA